MNPVENSETLQQKKGLYTFVLLPENFREVERSLNRMLPFLAVKDKLHILCTSLRYWWQLEKVSCDNDL